MGKNGGIGLVAVLCKYSSSSGTERRGNARELSGGGAVVVFVCMCVYWRMIETGLGGPREDWGEN